MMVIVDVGSMDLKLACGLLRTGERERRDCPKFC